MAGPDERDKAKAAGFFMARADEAIHAAERARSEDQAAALYKEAETWLYIASRCLNPQVARRPDTLTSPPRRAAAEPRSFGAEE
jgi:hypothetical protein